jgi:hypothetical protein
VRRVLLQLPFHELDSRCADLQIEFVSVRALACARLQQGGASAPRVHYVNRPCVEEWMSAVELLPEGWAYMTPKERLVAVDRGLALERRSDGGDGTSRRIPTSEGTATEITSNPNPDTSFGTMPIRAETGCAIRKHGALWQVRFHAETGDFPFRGNKSLRWLMLVLARPNRSLAITELISDADGKLRAGQLFKVQSESDQSALAAYQRALDDVNSLLDLGATADLETQKIDLLKRIRRAQEDRKLPGADPLKKAHHNVCTQIRKFIRALKDSMPQFSAHLSSSLKFDYPSVGYYPPTGSSFWKI